MKYTVKDALVYLNSLDPNEEITVLRTSKKISSKTIELDKKENITYKCWIGSDELGYLTPEQTFEILDNGKPASVIEEILVRILINANKGAQNDGDHYVEDKLDEGFEGGFIEQKGNHNHDDNFDTAPSSCKGTGRKYDATKHMNYIDKYCQFIFTKRNVNGNTSAIRILRMDAKKVKELALSSKRADKKIKLIF